MRTPVVERLGVRGDFDPDRRPIGAAQPQQVVGDRAVALQPLDEAVARLRIDEAIGLERTDVRLRRVGRVAEHQLEMGIGGRASACPARTRRRCRRLRGPPRTAARTPRRRRELAGVTGALGTSRDHRRLRARGEQLDRGVMRQSTASPVSDAMFTPLLKDQVAVITGGGTGIGLAIAKRLGSLGARIAIASRDSSISRRACAALREAGIDALGDSARRAQARAGRRDGRAHRQAFREPRHPRQQRGGELHLPRRGAVAQRLERRHRHRAERQLLLLARRRPLHDRARRGGSIVSILANYVWTGSAGTIHSAAAKAGVMSMTQTLAVEWAPSRHPRQRRRARTNRVARAPPSSSGTRPRPSKRDHRHGAARPMGPASRSRRRGGVPGLAHAGFITGEILTVEGARGWEEDRLDLSNADYQAAKPIG